MTSQGIPSLLQNALDELKTKGTTHQPIFIEVGQHVVPIALSRCIDLVKSQKHRGKETNRPVASEPSVLLLISQEQMESQLERADKDICDAFTCLSETQSPRADLSVLNGKSRVLATTPQRAIDHIRRDNIFLSSTKAVVLAYDFLRLEEETDEQMEVRACAFLDDCQFIFTKLNPSVRIELYTGTLSHLARTPNELVTDPLVLTQAEWERPVHPLKVISTPPHARSSCLDILYALQGQQYLVIHKTGKSWTALEKQLRATVPPIGAIGIGFDRLSELKVPQTVTVDTVVAIDLNSGELLSMIRHLNEGNFPFQQIVAIVGPDEAQEITTSKETLLMNNENKPVPETGEVLAGKIQMLVAKLNIDSNPEELETLKKTIKKNVPFHRRGYFAAYLLRELLASGEKKVASKPKAQPSPAKPQAAAETVKEKPQRAKKAPLERTQEVREQEEQNIPEGARTLYLNIGKMRRLYAKELAQIVQDQLGITKEDIYSIRVHDKYSFITLNQEHAEKAIEKLNGMDIRGRIASVSYSNKE